VWRVADEFVKRFRAERDYRKHATNAKWAEDKKECVPLLLLPSLKLDFVCSAHAAKVAHVPLGFLSAQKIISRAKRPGEWTGITRWVRPNHADSAGFGSCLPAGAVGGHGAPPAASKHDATAIVAGGAPSQFNIKSAWLHKYATPFCFAAVTVCCC
jgi:hypothetical protein